MLVTKTGSKLWRYAYNFDSKQKLLALGQYPLTSLADARIKRDDAKKLLAEGIDPSVNRDPKKMDTVKLLLAPSRSGCDIRWPSGAAFDCKSPRCKQRYHVLLPRVFA
jgi:hypothetical protein